MVASFFFLGWNGKAASTNGKQWKGGSSCYLYHLLILWVCLSSVSVADTVEHAIIFASFCCPKRNFESQSLVNLRIETPSK